MRSCAVHPQGSNSYQSLVWTKLIKKTVAGQDVLDPFKFRIMYDLANTAINVGHKLRPIGVPWSLFSRMRILAGGQVLEDMESTTGFMICSTCSVHRTADKMTTQRDLNFLETKQIMKPSTVIFKSNSRISITDSTVQAFKRNS